MRKIRLYYRGKLTNHYTLVDDVDYDFLNQWKWSYVKREKEHTAYVSRSACSNHKYYNILLHRLLLGAPSKFMVDHINHNGLDNRKDNLRLVTNQQNQYNTIKKRKGVCWQKDCKRYVAKIGVKNKIIYLGAYKTQREAQEAYNKAFFQYAS